jgi:hypothetical protein
MAIEAIKWNNMKQDCICMRQETVWGDGLEYNTIPCNVSGL